ncbi:MAG: Ig-like domain-containing protein [Elusimicrobiota bacterium]
MKIVQIVIILAAMMFSTIQLFAENSYDQYAGLHFGIIDAINSKVDDIGQKRTQVIPQPSITGKVLIPASQLNAAIRASHSQGLTTRPLTGATVTLNRMNNDGSLSQIPGFTCITDTEGVYRLDNIPTENNLVLEATLTESTTTLKIRSVVSVTLNDNNTLKSGVDLSVETSFVYQALKEICVYRNISAPEINAVEFEVLSDLITSNLSTELAKSSSTISINNIISNDTVLSNQWENLKLNYLDLGDEVREVKKMKAQRIEVVPSTATLLVGNTIQFSVYAFYADSSTKNCALLSSLTVSATNTISIDTHNGLIKAITPGRISISFCYENEVSSIEICVIAFSHIMVMPSSATFICGSFPFRAYAVYTDSSTVDCTELSVWTSSDSTIATVDSHNGIVTAISTGTTTISCFYNNVSTITIVNVNPKINGNDYFPLRAGMRMSYKINNIFENKVFEKIITVGDPVQIGEEIFYLFDTFPYGSTGYKSDLRFRQDSQSQVIELDNNVRTIRYKLSVSTNTRWSTQIWERLIKELVDVNIRYENKTSVQTPAGIFNDCREYYFIIAADYEWYEWLAPGIGLVKYAFYGYPGVMIEWELKGVVLE